MESNFLSHHLIVGYVSFGSELVTQDLHRSDAPMYWLEAIDFGRRMAVEKAIEKTETAPQQNAVFDESSNFLIYATLLGIKQERRKIPAAAANVNESKEPLTDPTLLCCAFKKHRIYLFSRREPEEPEMPQREGMSLMKTHLLMSFWLAFLIQSSFYVAFSDLPFEQRVTSKIHLIHLQSKLLAVPDIGKAVTTSLPDSVILHTTMGDVHMRPYPEECPKTVENFTTHRRNGYYDNLIFHHVIKGFMIQTGDSLGDGTGGQSNEFHKRCECGASVG
ncbi:hypothetical protein PTKIN_Ptkin03bG0063800 [Pterospermum kingtungense]